MTATFAIPCLLYKDAPKAIEWLHTAFGFTEHLIVPGNNDTIAHAELRLGEVMIMIGTAHNGSEFSKLIMHPADIDGFETQSSYIIVDEPDVIYERAKKAGAKIAIDIKTEEYGGRGFACYDLEGHLWNFGSYDPWQTPVK